MATNNYQWPTERSVAKKVASVHELDAISTLAAQIHTSSKKFDALGVYVIQSPFITCDLCGDNYLKEQCPSNIDSI